MRLLVTGDRNWDNEFAVMEVIEKIGPDVVIEGEQRGADEMARDVATYLKIQVDPFPANWTKYGKAAGPIRNQQMLDEGKPDLVVYFHHDLSASKGTADMVKRAEKAGIPVISWDEVLTTDPPYDKEAA